MNLYNIDLELRTAVDQATGELLKTEAEIDALFDEKDKKITNIALFVKELRMQADNLKVIIEEYSAKKKALENSADRLKNYLSGFLIGEKFKNEHVSLYWQTRKAVVFDQEYTSDEFEKIMKKLPKQYQTALFKKTVEPRKKEIQDYLNNGHDCDFAKIVENSSFVIR